MTAIKLSRSLVGIFCFVALLALPSLAAAQTVPFSAVLSNPCTAELVDVTGGLTATTTQKILTNGTLKVNIDSVFSGTGVGESTGTFYTFSDTNSVSITGTTTSTTSEVTSNSKFDLKGAKGVPNWKAKMIFSAVLQGGVLQSIDVKLSSDSCTGPQ
jgi:hypothetical protein